jgi:predicted transcriptional regulator
MLRDEQIAILYDIAQSIAFADGKEGEVQTLIVEGYVVKDGDLYELTEMGLKVVEEHVSQLAAPVHPGQD